MLGPPIIDRATVRLALPELMRIRTLLTDQRVALACEDVRRLNEFLMNGQSSSLFDRSPEEARQHAHGIAVRLQAGARPPTQP
jgi:hypothetical protein